MFALVVYEEGPRCGRAAWRKAFAVRQVDIGSAPTNELVIEDARVSPRHARLVLKDGKYILVDLESEHGTWLDGKRVMYPQVVREQNMIVIANRRIEVVTLAYEKLAAAFTPRDPMETELLAAIDNGDESSRSVYADWLEERGDHARAEVLRLQHDAPDDKATARVRQLVASLDLPWRARLSQLPIENCPRFAFECPQKWSALKPTETEGERFCGACNRTVHYCATIDDARDHAAKGRCVAIDIASPRWKGDLDGPFGDYMCAACELDVGAGLRECPRCGSRVDDMMLMGELA